MSMPLRVRHLLTAHSVSLQDLILSHIEMSAEYFFSLLDLGAIYLNQKRCYTDQVLNPGDYVRVHTEPKRYPPLPLSPDSMVMAWEKDFVVFDKPQGYSCHALVDNSKENLISFFEDHFKTSFFLTHRLDVGTGGLWLLALNSNFQRFFNQALQNHQVQKKYWARTENLWNLGSGIFTHYMKPGLRAPREIFDEAQPGFLDCRLKIESFENLFSNRSDLSIQLLTGRTHQIRAQLAHLGHRIVDDPIYGVSERVSAFKKSTLEKWALVAKELSFESDRKWSFALPPERMSQYQSLY